MLHLLHLLHLLQLEEAHCPPLATAIELPWPHPNPLLRLVQLPEMLPPGPEVSPRGLLPQLLVQPSAPPWMLQLWRFLQQPAPARAHAPGEVQQEQAVAPLVPLFALLLLLRRFLIQPSPPTAPSLKRP